MRTLGTIIIFIILTISQLAYGQISSDDFYKNGLSHLNNADFKSALIDFQKSLELKNDNEGCADILERIAYCYYELNEFQKSLHHVRKTLQLDKSNVGARHTRAKIFQKQSNEAKALKEYDTLIAIAKDNWVIYSERAFLYLSIGRKKLAIKDFNRVKELALSNGDKELYKSAEMSIQRIRK